MDRVYVKVNGCQLPTETPLDAFPLPPGRYSVTFTTAASGSRTVKNVIIKAGKENKLDGIDFRGGAAEGGEP